MRNVSLHCKACDGQLNSAINFLLDAQGELCNTCYMDIMEELLHEMLVTGYPGNSADCSTVVTRSDMGTCEKPSDMACV